MNKQKDMICPRETLCAAEKKNEYFMSPLFGIFVFFVFFNFLIDRKRIKECYVTKED